MKTYLLTIQGVTIRVVTDLAYEPLKKMICKDGYRIDHYKIEEPTMQVVAFASLAGLKSGQFLQY